MTAVSASSHSGSESTSSPSMSNSTAVLARGDDPPEPPATGGAPPPTPPLGPPYTQELCLRGGGHELAGGQLRGALHLPPPLATHAPRLPQARRRCPRR